MATIKSNQIVVNTPISSTKANLTIQTDNSKPLTIGVYEFQLVVVDDSGNESAPTTARVIIRDDKKPTAVIDAPTSIGFAEDLILSAQRSVDIGGKIKEYRWTLIKTP